MFKSQFVLLSLQIVLGFSLKSEASLVSFFLIQSSPRPLFSLFSDSCPMRPGTSKILAKMRNWEWIEQSHILAPFCFHRIPPEREKENPGNEGGQLGENTTNEVAPTASKRHVTYCHPISTTPQC